MLLVLKLLEFLKFCPAGFALFDGKAHASGYIGSSGSEMSIGLQFNQATLCVCVPVNPVCILWDRWWGFAFGHLAAPWLWCG